MRRAVLCIVTMLCCGRAHAALEPRPKVGLVFTIVAAGVRDHLGADLQSCVNDVQTAVRKELETRFPYFQWVTGSGSQTLTVSMKERQTAIDVEHILEYSATISSGIAPLHVLYDVNDPPPFEASLLRSTLPARVVADVARSEAELKRYFTTHVALVTRVDIENKSILLPVADLHPANASFHVEFLDDTAKEGKIQLFKPSVARDKGIYCEIQTFQFLPDITETAWNDAIPIVVKQKAKTFEVTVLEFTQRPHQNTSAGSVTSLNPGGQP